MAIQLNISDELEQALRVRAGAHGRTIEEEALEAIRRSMRVYERDAQLAPIRQAFAESGMTEDEAVDFFEEEKHAMRRERRGP